MREVQAEVLVVGAGPVGLVTALLLADAGLEVKIIDRDERPATRSYACALHPATLVLLNRLELAEPLIQQGRKVRTFAFYESSVRRAEVDLSKSHPEFPFLLVVPQNALEELLVERLRQRTGITVNWNHRFADLEPGDGSALVTLERLGGTATGYIVPHWETVVQKRILVRARFVIGADGHDSLVRQRLGIGFDCAGQPETFAAFEFESDDRPDEVRVVMDSTTTNVLWPLPGNHLRWTFQLVRSYPNDDFPLKERRVARLSESGVDDKIRDYVQRVTRERAPWFSADLKKLAWFSEVVFERRIVKTFGRGTSWLVGDAAHQTGPVGVQSMNVGFREAEDLSKLLLLLKVLRDEATVDSLDAFGRKHASEWKRLLGLEGGLKPTPSTNDWVRARCPRFLSCLPASNGDLAQLAAQIGLELS